MNLNPLTGLRRFLHRRKKLASLATYAVMTLVPRGANAILAVAYAAVLSPPELGIYGVCLAMQSVLAFLLDGGLSQAIIRTYYDHHADSDMARDYLARMVFTSRVTSLGFSFILLVAGIVAWGPLTADKVPLWPLFPLIIFAGYIERGGELLSNICRALERPRIFATGDSVQAIVLVASAFIFVVILKLGVLGGILALIAGSSSRTLTFSYLLRRREGIRWTARLSTFQEFREAIMFGSPMVFNQISMWGRQMGQRIVLIHVVSAAAVGVFFLGGSIANIMYVVAQSVGFVFDPLYYKRRVEDIPGFRERVQTFIKVYFAVLAIVVIPCILFADEISHFLFKDKYQGIGPVAAILLAASYVRVQYPFLAKQLLFQKKTIWLPLTTITPSLIALVLTPFVVQFGGLIAVSCLVLLAELTSITAVGLAVRRYEALEYPTGTSVMLLLLVGMSALWIAFGAPLGGGRDAHTSGKFVVAAMLIASCFFTWIWRNRHFVQQLARG